MTVLPILAIDIDLRRVHVVLVHGSERSVICVDAPVEKAMPLVRGITLFYPQMPVLIEVADPTVYSGMNQRGRLAWMVYNSWATAKITDALPLGTNVLVAPSSAWTCGYSEEVRHKMAGVVPLAKTKAQNHDLNECQAMAWFYRERPNKWTPPDIYFGDLRAGKKKN